MKINKNMQTVSQLTGKIKLFLENEFQDIEVVGEISNYIHHSSGHKYFSIKDEGAQLSCVMWRSTTLNFIPKNGMKVIVKGNLTVYPPRGNYQMECKNMTPFGEGDLYLAFEELKKKLSALGYFSEDRKKDIPKFPLKVGISTSPTGAAIQDMFKTISRRQPLISVYFRPTIVQGAEAAEDIVKAIRELSYKKVDVIIIGRGGGSIEDLWAYNMEIVANAIHNSKIPIISAVGHETDFTISDFVSDLRASTPTAAAEIVSSVTIDVINEFLETSRTNLTKSMQRIIDYKRTELNNLFGKRIQKSMNDKVHYFNQRIDEMQGRMIVGMRNKFKFSKNKIDSLESHLKAANPVSPLNKGFALLKYENSYIDKNQSIIDYNEIEIERKIENVNVKIIK
jgi:exodeoxyribonuclease VII large subunit